MRFSGLQKSDLINYPSLIACSLWLKGCNLACPYCHNPLLVGDVLRQGEGSIGEDEFFDF
ncbi:MAG TPA: anaerobic ribonucleoside-triphosphate reductase activating protein, partial [Spirochaetaceae bacterium]|nr:anaerobic ribonucleoside-triphosphate reductase activating protein [Spirochaetaceae bacterium]